MERKEKTILLVFAVLILMSLGIYTLSKRDNPDVAAPAPVIDETIPEEKPGTPVFDTFMRLGPKDTSFILFKDSPSFILIGDFTSDEGIEKAKIYEKMNEKYGFSNMVYVIDLAESEFDTDENGELVFGDIFLPDSPSICMIFEGRNVASFDTDGKTDEEIDEFFSQFYEQTNEDVEGTK